MSNDTKPQPLNYSSLTGPVKFTRHETEVGVTFTSHSSPLAGAYLIAACVGLAMSWPTLLLFDSFQGQPSWYYAARPLMGMITCVIFLVLIIVICRILWQRRKVPVCVSLVGDRFICMLPTALHMRLEYPVEQVADLTATHIGRTLTVSKVGNLSLRLRGEKRDRTLLHAYPLGDIQSIAQELSSRVAIIARRTPST